MIKVKKVTAGDITPPSRAHDSDGGLDLRAAVKCILMPDSQQLIPTGYAWELPVGTAGIIISRSGLAVRERVHAFHGLIDAGYRDELQVCLYNRGPLSFIIEPNDRIAQLVVTTIVLGEPELTAELGDSTRGENGFGSTGRE